MANLKLFLGLLVAALSLSNCGGLKLLLHESKSAAKLLLMHESIQKLALTVKAVELKTAFDGLRLIHSINEVIFKGEKVVFELNLAIPLIQHKIIHDSLSEAVENFAGVLVASQHHLHGPSAKLKEAFALSVEKSAIGVSKLAAVLKLDEFKKEVFLNNQLRLMFAEITFAVFKLKLEFDFFHKGHKELEVEIDLALAVFLKSIQNLKNDDVKAKIELVLLIQQLEGVHNFAYTKLQNYVRLHDVDDKNTGIVKEVVQKLSGSFDSFSHLSSDDRDLAQLKVDFEKLYKEATDLVKKLAQCDVEEGTPGELYIRSALFDSIAFSKFGEHELTDIDTPSNGTLNNII